MSFGGSSGGSGSIATSSDVALNNPGDGQVLSYSATFGKWENTTTPSAPVSSVNGYVGAVALTKGDVDLANVDNTSDVDKPVSTATQMALSAKEPGITAGTTGQYFRGDKTWQALNGAAVGLGNVNNTADTDKPVSTAVQTALDAKADTTTVGSKVLLIDNAAALPLGTPAGVVVIVKSSS